MLSLRDLQANFAKALFNNAVTTLALPIQENGIAVAQRLQIYRNNVLMTMTEALAAFYPCLQKLVGEEFFAALAQQYIINFPAAEGNLNNYGENFYVFLAEFPHVQQLPYLSEMARLEWAYHQAASGLNSVSTLEKLVTVAPAEYENLQFSLHSTAWLFSAKFPLLKIWQFCQEDASGDQQIDLTESQDKILISREGFEVVIEKLTEAEFTFLQTIQQGMPFSAVCETTLQADPNFNLVAVLQQRLQTGVITLDN